MTSSRWLDISQGLVLHVYGQRLSLRPKTQSCSACLWTKTEFTSKNSQKRKQGKYLTILTKQAWSISNLLYGFQGNFVRDTALSPEQTR